MQVLSLLPAQALGRLACINKALYCFANHEDLWRALTLEASSPVCMSLLLITHLHTCHLQLQQLLLVLLPTRLMLHYVCCLLQL